MRLKDRIMVIVMAVAVAAAMLHSLIPHHLHDGVVVTMIQTSDAETDCPGGSNHEHHHEGDRNQDCHEAEDCGTAAVSRGSAYDSSLMSPPEVMIAAALLLLLPLPCVSVTSPSTEPSPVPAVVKGERWSRGPLRAPPQVDFFHTA